MSDTPAFFKITPIDDILYIVLKGVWTIQADLAYISELSVLIGKRRSRHWGVCVDMTQWIMPMEVFDSPFKSKIMLKRRNQIGESWITESSTQGEELMSFFSDFSFKPQRFDNMDDALSYLHELGLKVPSSNAIKNIS
ncbi:hypothetical protein Q4574_04675 [Aliiglaciecola sp. 3_MG-2023]|uniref:hypothetical protein n=1 Tax=Aliiglaciecola sp. 3_MG-2023 TaxID=3062644 RepID=UPI0026E45C59|nr:hypothetical protein [Aliiglaciecola sp. 3_MG-2023]MDO6692566.1 hypothetical protein [Aliiglaciecola sp. 3_MG-2023]